MIRALGTIRGHQVILLGLEPENFRRMASNEPIRLNLAQLDPDGPTTGLPDIDIVIFDVKGTPAEDLKLLFEVDA